MRLPLSSTVLYTVQGSSILVFFLDFNRLNETIDGSRLPVMLYKMVRAFLS